MRYALFVARKALHIVDGESTGGSLRASGLAKSKDILRWKDALYTGPVPAGPSLKKLSEIRSRFWTKNKRSDEFEKRNEQLLTYREYDEVVLWFGSPSLCQLSLAQILDWFSQRSRHPPLSLVTAYGGTLREQEMHDAHAARKPVTAGQIQLARRFWHAYTSLTPAPLQRLLKSDLRALPGIRTTVYELLQEYPGVQDGLSRLERKLLFEIDGMGATSAAFAVGSVIRREWVGDMLLFGMLRRFVAARNPLLRYAVPFTGKFESYEFNGAKLALTAVGRQVLAGNSDHVVLNGIDRWIGGVHLNGMRVGWRWDDRLQRVTSVRS